ncbi:MAG: hypothetical protein Q9M14_02260 [Mariprofundaceae bacterium]|nr:hypothetical protein [Mariprofundaceae bacterium]
MKNYISASIIFYFKGEKFSFSADVDVDSWLLVHQGDMEVLYDTIATQNGLDRYRHEYDVMILEPVQFAQATGLAAQYICNGEFDIDGFLAARNKQTVMALLQPIAKKHLDIESLESNPKLQAALFDAYYANKKGHNSIYE